MEGFVDLSLALICILGIWLAYFRLDKGFNALGGQIDDSVLERLSRNARTLSSFGLGIANLLLLTLYYSTNIQSP
jgi:hypothetical protein